MNSCELIMVMIHAGQSPSQHYPSVSQLAVVKEIGALGSGTQDQLCFNNLMVQWGW